MSTVKEMIYVPRIALTASEPMALNATVDPMLIKDKRVVIKKVRRTELSGMFQPGLTCQVKIVLAEIRIKIAGIGEITYISNERGKGKSLVSSERPCLARNSGHSTDTS